MARKVSKVRSGRPLTLRGTPMRPALPYADVVAWRDDLMKWANAFARLHHRGPVALQDARDGLRNAGEWLLHWGCPLPDWFLAPGEPGTVDEAVRLMRLLADNRSDNPKKSLPDNENVRTLIRKLQKELPKGRTQSEIARDLTGEMPGDDREAQSLLRQARRFRHHYEPTKTARTLRTT